MDRREVSRIYGNYSGRRCEGQGRDYGAPINRSRLNCPNPKGSLLLVSLKSHANCSRGTGKYRNVETPAKRLPISRKETPIVVFSLSPGTPRRSKAAAVNSPTINRTPYNVPRICLEWASSGRMSANFVFRFANGSLIAARSVHRSRSIVSRIPFV